MIARGTPRGVMARGVMTRGVMTGIAQRVVEMAARMGIEGPVAMSGGWLRIWGRWKSWNESWA